MRHFFFILLFLLILSCNSTKGPLVPKGQNMFDAYYKQGQKYLKKGELECAIKAFHSAQLFDSVSPRSQTLKKKVDSLLPIFRHKKTAELKGRCILKELHFEPYPNSFSPIIEFRDSLIIFQSIISDSKLKTIRIENIKFQEYDPKDILFNPYRIVFSNGEVWLFEIQKKTFKKKMYPTVERDADGFYHSILDERSIIINRKARKKAMKEELYTFYRRE